VRKSDTCVFWSEALKSWCVIIYLPSPCHKKTVQMVVCYGLNMKCPSQGVEYLLLSWWHYFGRWWKVSRWGLVGGSSSMVGMPLMVTWSLSLSPPPVHHQTSIPCHMPLPSWCSASPQPRINGAKDYGLKHLKPWAKINNSSLKLFLSDILS
jgi:hypothetical protein